MHPLSDEQVYIDSTQQQKRDACKGEHTFDDTTKTSITLHEFIWLHFIKVKYTIICVKNVEVKSLQVVN